MVALCNRIPFLENLIRQPKAVDYTQPTKINGSETIVNHRPSTHKGHQNTSARVCNVYPQVDSGIGTHKLYRNCYYSVSMFSVFIIYISKFFSVLYCIMVYVSCSTNLKVSSTCFSLVQTPDMSNKTRLRLFKVFRSVFRILLFHSYEPNRPCIVIIQSFFFII